MDSVSNHPTTQSAKDTIVNGLVGDGPPLATKIYLLNNDTVPTYFRLKRFAHTNAFPAGPVGQTVQDQSAKTGAEFKDLANARQTPDTPAATGQPLTRT